MSRSILTLTLVLLFASLGTGDIFAREFPVESDLSAKKEVTLAPTPTSGLKKTVTIEELTVDWEKKTSYELFWPLTAGKIPGDKFYNLKVWRDNLMGYLFSDPVKKSEYLKQLANKRLLEAEKLLEIKRTALIAETLVKATGQLGQGLNLLVSAESTSRALWLRGEYAKDLRKYLIVLSRMESQAEGETKTTIGKSLAEIKDLVVKYKL